MEVRRLAGLEPLGWVAPCVALGNFDGVHLGHQALVRGVLQRARDVSGQALALTFDPHPARVLRPDRAPAALSTFEQKARLLGQAGLERLAVLTFDARLAAFTPEEFARRVLRDALRARLVCVGENFRFGRGRVGGVAELRALGALLGFELSVLGPVVLDGRPVSSTRIREALMRGAVSEARALAGRDYFVEGLVVKGDARGRTLGFPTANLEPWNELLPLAGVYAARCTLLADAQPDRAGSLGGTAQSPPALGVVNVGRRPTFDGREVRLEAHLLDSAGDLYGAALRVEFVERLRDEIRFDSVEALVEQIRADVAHARQVLEPAD